MIRKNKISTLSYFTKRLKDSGYVVWKLINNYPIEDCRKWSILINPGRESVIVTCKVNHDGRGVSPAFDIYDGGFRCQKNFTLITDSLEVVMNHFIQIGVTPDSNEFKTRERQKQQN